MSYEIIIKQYGKVVAKVKVKDKAEADTSELKANNFCKTNRLGKSMGFTIESKKAEIGQLGD